MSQKTYQTIAKLTQTEMSADVGEIVKKAQKVLDGRGERMWLEWAGEDLMPSTSRAAQEEAEAVAKKAEDERREAETRAVREEVERRIRKAREEKEREEQARREREEAEARAVVEAAVLAQDRERERVLNDFADGKLTVEELQLAMDALDAEELGQASEGVAGGGNDGAADAEGESDVREDREDEEMEIVEEPRAEKRKRAETIEGLREVSGKVRNHLGFCD